MDDDDGTPRRRPQRKKKGRDIDAIAQQVHELEGAVGQLDAYSRRLEAKFDALAESAKAKT